VGGQFLNKGEDHCCHTGLHEYVSKTGSFSMDMNPGSKPALLSLVDEGVLTREHFLFPAYALCITKASISAFAISQMNHRSDEDNSELLK
jgi:hypothetical protein